MKKILIALILLILAVGAVSANDNLTGTPDVQKSYLDESVDISIDNDSSDMITGNEDLTSTGNESEDMMKSSGTQDPDIEISVSSEIVKGKDLYVRYSDDSDFEGNIKIYIDNKYCDSLYVALGGGYQTVNAQNLDLGMHNCSLVYEGNDYYAPFNKTFEFEVVNIAIRLYEKMYPTDNIYVEAPDDATGTVTIRINKSTKRYKLNDDKTVSYDLYDLKCGKTYDVEVNYSGNYGNLTKKQNITMDYPLYLYEKTFYKQSGFIFFIMPSDITGKIIASIDGKDAKYDINKLLPGTISRSPNYYDGMIFDFAPIYFKNLQVGNHTVTVSYSGDKKYPAKSITENITIHQIPEISDGDYWKPPHIGSLVPITINLPKGNVGTFSLYLMNSTNKELIECVNLTDGRATINYNCTALGEYQLIAAYDTNHDHFEYLKKIEVSSIEFPNPNFEYYLNSNIPIKIALPNDTKGNFSVYVSKDWGEFKLYKSVKIENGHATINFKTAKADFYIFQVISDSNYGFENKTDGYNIEDGSKVTPLTSSVVYADSGKITLKIYGQNGKLVGKNVAVNLKIASASIKAKTNAKGSISVKIPKLKPGKYTITAKYNKAKVDVYLKVKHLLTLKTITVKKSTKKLTLQATLGKINGKYLKNKQITFKFNGKTYKAKTNKKGVAKVSIKKSMLKKLKVGKKITYQATYLKDTVKKTAKVKK